jgi:hypothetical protein
MSLAYLPEDQVQTHLANGRLVQVLADWCPPLRSVAALIARFGSAGIFRVRNLLHPCDGTAIQRLGHGKMGHRRARRGAVPVADMRRDQDNIARPHFLNSSAFALHPAATRGDDQRLAERMRMPGGPGTRLEMDRRSAGARWPFGLKEGLDPDGAGEVLRRSRDRGLRIISLHGKSGCGFFFRCIRVR